MDAESRQKLLRQQPPRPSEAVLPLILARYQELHTEQQPVRTGPAVKRFRKWLPYAAAILLVATAAVWLFFVHPGIQPTQELGAAADILPGTNRATITLGD